MGHLNKYLQQDASAWRIVSELWIPGRNASSNRTEKNLTQYFSFASYFRLWIQHRSQVVLSAFFWFELSAGRGFRREPKQLTRVRIHIFELRAEESQFFPAEPPVTMQSAHQSDSDTPMYSIPSQKKREIAFFYRVSAKILYLKSTVCMASENLVDFPSLFRRLLLKKTDIFCYLLYFEITKISGSGGWAQKNHQS